MTGLVSGMLAPHFGDESSLSSMIRAGSRSKRILCFVSIDVRCFPVPPWLRVPEVEDDWFRRRGCLDVSQPWPVTRTALPFIN
jgi:hypothetical protein